MRTGLLTPLALAVVLVACGSSSSTSTDNPLSGPGSPGPASLQGDGVLGEGTSIESLTWEPTHTVSAITIIAAATLEEVEVEPGTYTKELEPIEYLASGSDNRVEGVASLVGDQFKIAYWLFQGEVGVDIAEVACTWTEADGNLTLVDSDAAATEFTVERVEDTITFTATSEEVGRSGGPAKVVLLEKVSQPETSGEPTPVDDPAPEPPPAP